MFSTEGHLFPVDVRFRSKVWQEKTEKVSSSEFIQKSDNLSVSNVYYISELLQTH